MKSGVLTRSALLHSPCYLKATLMNIERYLNLELLFYNFELVPNAAKAAKHFWWIKGEGTITNRLRNLSLISRTSTIKPKMVDCLCVFQDLEENQVNHCDDFGKSTRDRWIFYDVTKTFQNFQNFSFSIPYNIFFNFLSELFKDHKSFFKFIPNILIFVVLSPTAESYILCGIKIRKQCILPLSKYFQISINNTKRGNSYGVVVKGQYYEIVVVTSNSSPAIMFLFSFYTFWKGVYPFITSAMG